jgi:Cu+-exporting ATPase
MAKDPICGMTADEMTASRAERNGQIFYFCCGHCRKQFLEQPVVSSSEAAGAQSWCGEIAGRVKTTPSDDVRNNSEPACCDSKLPMHQPHVSHSPVTAKPSANAKYFCPMCPGVESDKPGDCPKCSMVLDRNPAWVAPTTGKTIYTCPMHPEVQQDHPGSCPKCGMALEPKTVSAVEEKNSELINMTWRLWIGAAFALPVFLLAMAHLIPEFRHQSWVMGDASRWIQFVLATPVVLWAGWPFFYRGWLSMVTRQLNMFTLVAIGIGTAYLFSAVVMLVPGAFPSSFGAFGKVGVYFESAAAIVVLVLLYPFFGVLLSPIIAGVAMSLSSVSVIGNALRLRGMKI